jgi:acetolactate synthase-1/3 small subunit
MDLTFVVHVVDRPGVLNRISSLIRRRGLNIDSITVGHAQAPGMSRMTLVIQAGLDAAPRIEANLRKLVHVQHVEHVTSLATVCRDLALIKIEATVETRGHIMQLVDVFRARVVDVSPGSLVVEATGTEEKIDGLIGILEPFGIVEIARTGRVAMTRGQGAIRDAVQEPAGRILTTDDSIVCSV